MVLIGAATIARNRHDTLLAVEEPVMDWLLDGTDVSGWARFQWLGGNLLTFGGIIALAVIAFYFNRRASAVVIGSMIFGLTVAWLVRDLVGRARPDAAVAGSGSFPSLEVVQTSVFWGLVVLFAWWLGAPRIVWQLLTEGAIVASLLVSIDLMVRGQHWPSDIVGSGIVTGLTLITAAMLLEDNPPARASSPSGESSEESSAPWRRQRERKISSAPSA